MKKYFEPNIEFVEFPYVDVVLSSADELGNFGKDIFLV